MNVDGDTGPALQLVSYKLTHFAEKIPSYQAETMLSSGLEQTEIHSFCLSLDLASHVTLNRREFLEGQNWP